MRCIFPNLSFVVGVAGLDLLGERTPSPSWSCVQWKVQQVDGPDGYVSDGGDVGGLDAEVAASRPAPELDACVVVEVEEEKVGPPGCGGHRRHLVVAADGGPARKAGCWVGGRRFLVPPAAIWWVGRG